MKTPRLAFLEPRELLTGLLEFLLEVDASLELFRELFKENSDKCPDGLKVDDNWVSLIESSLQTILHKAVADK